MRRAPRSPRTEPGPEGRRRPHIPPESPVAMEPSGGSWLRSCLPLRAACYLGPHCPPSFSFLLAPAPLGPSPGGQPCPPCPHCSLGGRLQSPEPGSVLGAACRPWLRPSPPPRMPPQPPLHKDPISPLTHARREDTPLSQTTSEPRYLWTNKGLGEGQGAGSWPSHVVTRVLHSQADSKRRERRWSQMR